MTARGAGRTARWTTLIAGLAVGLGAGVATAHGLYEVAVAAGAPKPIACLYPLITDGLALVAYASTARLSGGGRAYAWTVVVLATGLSGLAQASFLAGGVPSAPPALRSGVGAWPAIAAAVVAHLIFLLGSSSRVSSLSSEPSSPSSPVSNASSLSVQPAGQLDGRLDTRVDTALDGWTDGLDTDDVEQPRSPGDVQPSDDGLDGVQSPVRARARQAALDYLARHGDLPSVRQLVELAEVSRGSAAEALKELRATVGRLHLVTPENPKEDTQ